MSGRLMSTPFQRSHNFFSKSNEYLSELPFISPGMSPVPRMVLNADTDHGKSDSSFLLSSFHPTLNFTGRIFNLAIVVER